MLMLELVHTSAGLFGAFMLLPVLLRWHSQLPLQLVNSRLGDGGGGISGRVVENFKPVLLDRALRVSLGIKYVTQVIMVQYDPCRQMLQADSAPDLCFGFAQLLLF